MLANRVISCKSGWFCLPLDPAGDGFVAWVAGGIGRVILEQNGTGLPCTTGNYQTTHTPRPSNTPAATEIQNVSTSRDRLAGSLGGGLNGVVAVTLDDEPSVTEESVVSPKLLD